MIDAALEGGLSACSVAQVHRILHAAFRQAVRWQLIAVNPSDGVSPPRARAPQLTTPDAAQIARILDAADERFRPAFAVLAGTGLRRGELAALRWEALDLDGKRPFLRVEGSMQRSEGLLTVLAPKTDRSRRMVPLPASVASVLRRVRVEQNERRLVAGAAWSDGGYVFDRGDGRPMDPDDLTKAFQTARTRAKVPGVRLHNLRHAFATLQMRAGTNARVVSDLLGHATVAFTLMAYSHPDAAMADGAMTAVDAVLGDAIADW